MTQAPSGEIVAQSEIKQIYVTLFERTILVSFGVMIACIVLAYPIAYLLATLPSGTSNLLMILVLLPFWTSLLVRTTSWIVLLQTNGVINDLLVALGILGDDGRIQMIYNMTGTFIAMTHILLPFMVLPLYSVMKTIPRDHMRAALSLGANPAIAFIRIYMPQTIPGVGAGSILVFILAIGYYITPALVGGQDGQLISNIIEYHMKKSLNWSLAAALGGILLAGVLALYWLYNRIVGQQHEACKGRRFMTSLPSYAGPFERIWYYVFRVLWNHLRVLIAPIIVMIRCPLTEPYFTFTPEMLALKPEAFSMRWYQDIWTTNNGCIHEEQLHRRDGSTFWRRRSAPLPLWDFPVRKCPIISRHGNSALANDCAADHHRGRSVFLLFLDRAGPDPHIGVTGAYGAWYTLCRHHRDGHALRF